MSNTRVALRSTDNNIILSTDSIIRPPPSKIGRQAQLLVSGSGKTDYFTCTLGVIMPTEECTIVRILYTFPLEAAQNILHGDEIMFPLGYVAG